jgi:SAM-dependent methyltransferase
MNLLPRSLNDFRSRNYWDEFFRQRGLTNSFEWYGEYTDLCGILHKYSRSQHNVLVTGCGNSRLSEDLYDIGYHSITNIDISDVVIKQMTDRNEEKRPNLTFAKMDVLKMELPDASYDVVIDKGTLDSLCSDESEEVASNVTAMFNEIGRVLKAGGRYVCISLCQEHILKQIVDGFVSKGGWFVRVHKVEVVSGRNEDDHGLPVFAFVMTKAKPGLPVKVLEVSLDGSEQVIRVETAEQFQSEIRSVQQYAMFRQFMKKYHPGDEFQLTLWSSRDASVDNPRYTLNVVDSPTSPSQRGKYAAFIVPQGRENEWLFASPEGRAQLTLGAGFQRLAIASTHRGQTYESLQAVKDELSGSILELAPHDLPPNQRVLFLSVGEDVGQRTVVYRNRSELSGEFVVEDVAQDDNSISRRLIFLNKPTVIQSEVKLVMTVAMPEKGNTKKKGKKKQMKTVKDRRQIDISHLSCAHHKHVISGLAWVKSLANRSSEFLCLLGLQTG